MMKLEGCEKMAISDWPEDQRPREKLLKCGPETLADAELLAIFLRTGVKGKTAVDLARELLIRFGGLLNLIAARPEQVYEAQGLGAAKYVQLKAAVELARRALHEEIRGKDILGSPKQVRDYLRLALSNREHEVFVGIFLDAQNRVIATEDLSRGTLTQTSVYPREIVKRALYHNAGAIIFAHNHPSGLCEPSRADEVLTRALKEALALVDVKVLDHFIVGGASAMSFAERGLL
jgi:DNA repair protein RadC